MNIQTRVVHIVRIDSKIDINFWEWVLVFLAREEAEKQKSRRAEKQKSRRARRRESTKVRIIYH
jgi:hypothetical protein